jgi:hypothetical protein
LDVDRGENLVAAETYKTLIETLVEQRANGLALNQSEAFLDVVTELILQDHDLSIDEIDAGITAGSGDGQIDAMYVLVNGALMDGEGSQKIPEKGPLEISITLIQAKFTEGFEENVLKIIRTTIGDLFDLSKQYDHPLPQYSDTLQEAFANARRALLASAGRTAKITVRVYYATKASTEAVHPSVHATARLLKADLSAKTATSDVEIIFVGAMELINKSRLPKTRQRNLGCHSLIPSDNGDSIVCLVTIDALMRFLSDENGHLIRSMFDSNVRDFLGQAEVNEAIKATLHQLSDGDFWWFNNGITIVASAVDQKGKTLALSDPLLVNGLQTSNVIHSFITDLNVGEELKSKRRQQIVLVKLIVPPNERLRDDIIKATNSQTHIPKAYLRGMDTVHRNIEDHLKGANLFYERRKNQYKNLGKTRDEIITLAEMAQAIMAAILHRPSDARGRPTSLLKSDEYYQRLFSEGYELDTFKNIINVKRSIMTRLSELFPEKSASFRNDIVFHVLAFISAQQFTGPSHAAAGWRSKTPDCTSIDSAIQIVAKLFQNAGETDRVAKSPTFQKAILTAAVALS